jgi:hypothetical protein
VPRSIVYFTLLRVTIGAWNGNATPAASPFMRHSWPPQFCGQNRCRRGGEIVAGPRKRYLLSRRQSVSAGQSQSSELGRVHTLLPTAIWNWRFPYAAIPLLLFPLARRMINPLCCFGPVSIIRKVNGSCANAADENDENLLNGLSLI